MSTELSTQSAQSASTIKTQVYANALQRFDEQNRAIEGENGLLGKLGAFGLTTKTRVSNLQNEVVQMPSKEALNLERAQCLQRYWMLDNQLLAVQDVLHELAEAAQFVLPKAREYNHDTRLKTHPKLAGEIALVDQTLTRCSQELMQKYALLANELRKMEAQMVSDVKPEVIKLAEIANAQATRSTGWRAIAYAASFVSTGSVPQLTEEDFALLNETSQGISSGNAAASSSSPASASAEGELAKPVVDGTREEIDDEAVQTDPTAGPLDQEADSDVTKSLIGVDFTTALSLNPDYDPTDGGTTSDQVDDGGLPSISCSSLSNLPPPKDITSSFSSEDFAKALSATPASTPVPEQPVEPLPPPPHTDNRGRSGRGRRNKAPQKA